MTHNELVKRAVMWLRGHERMSIVIAELHTRTMETPDAIGFIGEGGSTLIECKTSRSDFLADAKKCFRWEPKRGMGDRRYFLAPPDVIRDADDLGDWGHLVCHPGIIKVAREAKFQQANKNAEIVMLMSAIRRLEISTAVFVIQDSQTTGEGNEH